MYVPLELFKRKLKSIRTFLISNIFDMPSSISDILCLSWAFEVMLSVGSCPFNLFLNDTSVAMLIEALRDYCYPKTI